MAKYKLKPTVTFSRKEQADAVCGAIQDAFHLGKEGFKTKWIQKSKWDTYVISWDEYNDYSYVVVKTLKKLEVADEDVPAPSDDAIPF